MSLIDVLGSTPRLKIIRELSHGPRYVSELTEAVGMDGKTAAHHLSTLEESGIVEHYRRGNRKYYRLIRTIELTVAPPPERTFILQARERTDAPSTGD
ncbi:MAG: winged helix-turn-helix domain-containing protein [Halalkalicoccus sp.]